MNVAYYIGGAIVALWLIGGIYRQMRRKNKMIHVIDDNCTGCKRCVTIMGKCKHNVLELVTYDNGKNHIEVKYPDRCTACGNCVGLCKFNALELIEKTK